MRRRGAEEKKGDCDRGARGDVRRVIKKKNTKLWGLEGSSTDNLSLSSVTY